jgi:hypothetical protein
MKLKIALINITSKIKNQVSHIGHSKFSTNLNNLIITNKNYINLNINPLSTNKSNLENTKNSQQENYISNNNNKNFNESYNSINKEKDKDKENNNNNNNYENLNEKLNEKFNNDNNYKENEDSNSKILNETRKISINSKNYKQFYRGSKGKFDFQNLSIQNNSKEILRTEGSYEGKNKDYLLNKIMENPFKVNPNTNLNTNNQEDSCEKDIDKKVDLVFHKFNKGLKFKGIESSYSLKGKESK